MLQPEPSRKLLDSARRGDASALAALYDSYGDQVYGLAFRLTHSFADAEDILQDVFVGLPETLRSYDARGAFRHWLARVATRTALMKLRAPGRRREISFSKWARFANSPRTDPLTRLELERALEELSEDDRAVIVLRLVEGLSHREVADLLGISASAAWQRQHRALRRLRRLLS